MIRVAAAAQEHQLPVGSEVLTEERPRVSFADRQPPYASWQFRVDGLRRVAEPGELWSHKPVRDETLWFEMKAGVLHVFGEIDVLSSPLLFAAVTERAERGVVIVDLTGVTFIDSSGLHALTRLRRDLPRMRIADASRAVLRILEITGLVELLIEERQDPDAERPPREQA